MNYLLTELPDFPNTWEAKILPYQFEEVAIDEAVPYFIGKMGYDRVEKVEATWNQQAVWRAIVADMAIYFSYTRSESYPGVKS